MTLYCNLIGLIHMQKSFRSSWTWCFGNRKDL